MPTYNDYGIILSSTELNETDKILSIYTRENGLVRAVCKGARKPTSKFISKADQLSCCYFQFAKGKNLDTVCELEQINSFPKLRNNLTCLSYGILFLDVVSSFAHEKESESNEVYDLLCSSLDKLQHGANPELLATIFIKDFLSTHGLKPQLETCVSCSKDVLRSRSPGVLESKEIYPYSSALGGLLCNKCANLIDHKTVSKEVLSILIEPDKERYVSENLRKALELLKEHINARAKNDIKSFELVFSL